MYHVGQSMEIYDTKPLPFFKTSTKAYPILLKTVRSPYDPFGYIHQAEFPVSFSFFVVIKSRTRCLFLNPYIKVNVLFSYRRFLFVKEKSI
jgi:hypothetical protein